MINYVIEINDLDENQTQIADLNNDGDINIMDIIILMNIILSS